MIVYRIGHPDYVKDISGYGASLEGGRWNKRGERVVYTSSNSALSIVELLSHIKGVRGNLPYVILKLETFKSKVLELAEITHKLPDNWAHTHNGKMLTQKIGSQWLNEMASPLLKVPSVHTPDDHNFLINPRHAGLKMKIVENNWYLYDYRLVQSVS